MLDLFMDPVILSRLQFAFTIGFHIFFPTLTIGLSVYLVIMEWKWLRTNDLAYLQQYKFWLNIFALGFGIGVVSGVVLSYEFGTNFAAFIQKTGNVLGPLLAYEVLTAFFLEAGFIGIMLFGWNKVGPKLHFFATIMVSLGTIISAFWILSANSWMQTPQGHIIDEFGTFFADDWFGIIFSPSFHYRYMHMIMASFVTATFVIAGVCGFYCFRGTHPRFAKQGLSFAMWAALILVPLQIFLGDMHGLNTKEHQPAKVAAMEGLWKTTKGADLVLFGFPDQNKKETDFEIAVPKLSSLILTHSWDGEVLGLNEFAEKDWPPVATVFYSFRIMVGIGVLLLVVTLTALFLRMRGTMYKNKVFHLALIGCAPLGFVATIAGWCVTEVGRQPFIVYDLVRTSDSISYLLAEKVLASLLAFVVVYTLVLIAFIFYLFKTIRKGPDIMEDTQFHEPDTAYAHIAMPKD
jgi:cytochrome d ubiquinol oxidase subunit I